jgi:hypothetical protein
MNLTTLLLVIAMCAFGGVQAAEPCPIPAGKYLGVLHTYLENGSLDSKELEMDFEIHQDGKLSMLHKTADSMMNFEWTGKTWVWGDIVPVEFSPRMKGNLLIIAYKTAGKLRAECFLARVDK